MTDLIDVFVGRQPIFDRELNTFAYELLFRSNNQNNYAVIIGGDTASAQVMVQAFGDIGIKDLAGDHKVFINFTEGLLLREFQPFFPRNKVIIEILETVKPTPNLIGAVKTLRKNGYVIALDDYVFNSDLEVLEPLADIIKVDIMEVGPRQLIEHIQRLKSEGVKLLAEKVETQAQYDFCKKIGFDYFQGYFFAKPAIVKGQRLPTNKLALLELLASVYDPEIDMSKLSSIIGREVSLSQKLLKFLAQNMEGNAKVNSIHEAVVRFGLNRLKSWVGMLVLSGLDDKASELYQTTVTRAKYCELVAERLGLNPKDLYFTVGLFSTLDALMDQELGGLVSSLNFDDSILEALLKGTNKAGLILQSVKALELGDVDFKIPGDCTPGELSQCYLQAIQFSQRLLCA